jgi:hypothetical protein
MNSRPLELNDILKINARSSNPYKIFTLLDMGFNLDHIEKSNPILSTDLEEYINIFISDYKIWIGPSHQTIMTYIRDQFICVVLDLNYEFLQLLTDDLYEYQKNIIESFSQHFFNNQHSLLFKSSFFDLKIQISYKFSSDFNDDFIFDYIEIIKHYQPNSNDYIYCLCDLLNSNLDFYNLIKTNPDYPQQEFYIVISGLKDDMKFYDKIHIINNQANLYDLILN